MKLKSKKSALLMSFTSLLICFAMLVGSTFAWFTDTATTGVNKIQAGNLDVELLMYKKANGESDYVNISKEPAPIFGSENSTVAQNNNLDTLWEPGKTQVAYLAIKNEGNLDLKYQVTLNVINPADGKDLYQVMQYAIAPDVKGTDSVLPEWTTGKSVIPGAQIVSGTNTEDAAPAGVKLLHGETHYFALLVHMDENAGNGYQNGKVEFDLTVYAAQLNSESDSFNNEYDKNAEYDKGDAPPADAKKVATAEELNAAVKSAAAGDYILLTNDIDLTSALAVGKAITLDLNGKTLKGTAMNTIKLSNNADLTVKDSAEGGKITNSYNGSADPATIDLQGTDAVFTLESGVVESNAKDNLYTIAISNSKKKACTVNINGGTVSNPDEHVKSRAISASSGMTLNISGGAVAGGLYGLDLYAGSNTTITGGSVTANAFDGRTDEYGKQYGVHMKGEAALTVGSLAVESVPVVQGIKFESSGVATELPTIKLVKGNMTSPIYSMEAKYNYPLFKLGIVADAPVTFVDDTAKYFLPDKLQLTKSNDVYIVTAK